MIMTTNNNLPITIKSKNVSVSHSTWMTWRQDLLWSGQVQTDRTQLQALDCPLFLSLLGKWVYTSLGKHAARPWAQCQNALTQLSVLTRMEGRVILSRHLTL